METNGVSSFDRAGLLNVSEFVNDVISKILCKFAFFFTLINFFSCTRAAR